MNIKHVQDYYPQIKERYPDLEDWEIDKILKHGMRSLFMVTTYGADVLLHNRDFTMYFGKLFNKKTLRKEYANLKWRIKLRIKWKREKRVWDGYYYFGVSEETYQEYVKIKKGRLKKKMTIEKLYGFKIPEEAYKTCPYPYFFKIQIDEENHRMTVYKETYTTRDIIYIGKRDSHGKIIFVDNEKRSC